MKKQLPDGLPKPNIEDVVRIKSEFWTAYDSADLEKLMSETALLRLTVKLAAERKNLGFIALCLFWVGFAICAICVINFTMRNDKTNWDSFFLGAKMTASMYEKIPPSQIYVTPGPIPKRQYWNEVANFTTISDEEFMKHMNDYLSIQKGTVVEK